VVRQREVLVENFEISDGVELPVGDYDWWFVRADGSTSDHRPVSVNGSVRAGDFFSGESREYELGLEWRPNSRVNFDLEYELNDVELEEGSFDVHVGRLETTYNVNRELSITALLQYDSVSDDAALNARTRWIIEPGNELFLVVNQAWSVFAGRVDPLETNLTVKLGWTFRF